MNGKTHRLFAAKVSYKRTELVYHTLNEGGGWARGWGFDPGADALPYRQSAHSPTIVAEMSTPYGSQPEMFQAILSQFLPGVLPPAKK